MSNTKLTGFYNTWPNLGVKLSRQWTAIRENTEKTAPLVRAAYVDAQPSSANDPGNHDLSGWAIGERDFRNRFRIWYDKTNDRFSIQYNSGTEAVEVWDDYLSIRQVDGRVTVHGYGGLDSAAGGFYTAVPRNLAVSGTFTPASTEWAFTHNLNTKPVLWNAFNMEDKSVTPQTVDVSDPNTAYFYFSPAQAGRALVVAEQARGEGIRVTAGDQVFPGAARLGFNPNDFYLTPEGHGDPVVNINWAGVDHGDLTGLADDDHSQYLLASQATDRSTFTSNWTDLTDAGATTLHKHDHGGQDGLTDDDHPQYALTSGAREITGDQTFASEIIVKDKVTAGSFYSPTFGEVAYANQGYLSVEQTNGASVFTTVNSLKFEHQNFYLTADSDGKPVVNFRGQGGTGSGQFGTGIQSQTFSSSKEWQFNHGLGVNQIIWAVYDDQGEAIIPDKVDASDSNLMFFYFTEASAGRAVVAGGPLVNTVTVKGNIDSAWNASTDTVSFSHSDFYITADADGNPVINSQPSAGGGSGVSDHGALTGLTDDDHSQYLLASDATNRTTFATNWTDLTDGGATTLHSHAASAPNPGFYGVIWSDGTVDKRTDRLSFNSADFYLDGAKPTVNLRVPTNFIQSGAGAVTRTILAKERDTLSIADYGATGVTGEDGGAAYALELATAPLGRESRLAIGQYRFDATKSVVGPANIVGEGCGAGPGAVLNDYCSQIYANFASGDLLYFGPSLYGTRLENFQINSGVGQRTAGAGIKISSTGLSSAGANYRLNNLAFNNQYTGIELEQLHIGTIENTYHQAWKNAAIVATNDGVHEGAGGAWTKNFFFGDTAAATTQSYIIDTRNGYTRISDNLLLGAQVACRIIANAGNPVGAFEVVHNWIEENDIIGIQVGNSGGAAMSMLRINNNEFSVATQGGAARTNFQSHITINAGSAGAYLTDVQINDNIMRTTASGGSGNAFISANSGTGMQICRNVLEGLDANNTVKGIVVGSEAAQVDVLDNVITGTFSAKYSLTTACNFRDFGSNLTVSELPTCRNGSTAWCADGTSGTNPVAAGGSGCVVIRDAGVWKAMVLLDDVGPGFYGVNFRETDGSPDFRNDTIYFDSASFYLHPNSIGKPVLSLRGIVGSGGVTDHGALTGLADDDHSQYLLASDATNRSTFAANWTDLTDGGATTLHSHAASAPNPGFYGVNFRETDGSPPAFRNDTLIFDSTFFYLQGNSVNKPIVSLRGGTPGGASSQVQVNKNGVFSGTAALTFDNETDTFIASSGALTVTPSAVTVGPDGSAPVFIVGARSDGGGIFRILGNGANADWQIDSSNGDMRFLANDVEKVRFDASGAINMQSGSRIINLPAPASATDAARLVDVGPGFYGVNFRDDSHTLRDDTLVFNSAHFYLSETAGSKPVLNLKYDIDILQAYQETGAVSNMFLDTWAPYGYTVESVEIGCRSGSMTAAFYIISPTAPNKNGISVPGLDPIAVTTTKQKKVPTSGGVVSEGGGLLLSIPANSSGKQLRVSVKAKKS